MPHENSAGNSVYIIKECIPKLPIKCKCDIGKCWALFVFLPVDSEVCISGTHSDLETQSHPLIQVEGLHSSSNSQGFYHLFQV